MVVKLLYSKKEEKIMDPVLLAIIIVVSVLLVIIFSLSYVCYVIVFKSRRPKVKEEYPTPGGEEYDPYREEMVEWIKKVDKIPYKEVEITSYDGLKLRGKYFEYSKDAPIEILVHGYRGNARRDLSAGVARSFEIGHSALLVDQRGSGESEGRQLTFGIKEKRDVIKWIDFVINEINKDAKIILTGMSMGAATVLMCAGMELPKNVIGVLADCGYSTNKEIISKVARGFNIPIKLIYPIIKLGALIFGGFRLDSDSPYEAVQRARVPIIFFHGNSDNFVPCEMSEKNYNACTSEKKRLVIIDGAIHGTSYPKDRVKYVEELKEFFK